MIKPAIILLLFAGSQAFAEPLKAFAPRRGSSILWSNGQASLQSKDLDPRLGKEGWVALRLGAQSPLLGLQSSRFFARIPDSNTTDYVFLPVDDLKLLDTLAPIAHEETGSCGALEFMPRGYSLQSSIDFAAPKFSSWAQFSEIPPILSDIDAASMQNTVATLAALTSRYHNHPVGQTAPQTLAQSWRSLRGTNSAILIDEFPHQNTAQNSVIAHLPGVDQANDTVILGAHLDSIAIRGGGSVQGAAPGADDNASGLAILQEIMRIVESRGMRFHRSVEWQAYAAEEVGLIGSREIAKHYREQSKTIAGMLQFDMAAYSSSADQEGLLYFLEDYTSRDLRRSAMDWLLRYVGPIVRTGKLPSGSASDHKSWWEQGYSTLFSFENPLAYNPHIHSPADTNQFFDQGARIKNMAALGLLFLIHEAGWTQLDAAYASQSTQALPVELANDLYLAIQKADDTSFYLAVSASLAIDTIEFCPITDPKDLTCAQERETLNQAQTRDDRKIFYQRSTFPLSSQGRWRILGYDAQGQLKAWRQVELGS